MASKPEERYKVIQQGPKWRDQSCALDTMCWVAKALGIFGVNGTGEWRVNATATQVAFAKAIEEDWAAVVADDGLKRDELAKEVLRLINKVPGDMVDIKDLWEVLTDKLPTTTIKLQKSGICQNAGCRATDVRKTAFVKSISLSGGPLGAIDPKPTTLVDCLGAWFGCVRGNMCKQCKAERMGYTMRAAEGELPAVMSVVHMRPETLSSTDWKASFRFYGPAPAIDRRYRSYEARVVVVGEHLHWTAYVLRWKAGEVIGGLHYDGARKKERVLCLGKEEIQAQLAELKERSGKITGETGGMSVLLFIVRSDWDG